jgi:GH43 family beta-xylosidase
VGKDKVYGPGHNSFFRSPDGKEDWIAYHAKTGTARTFADRTARAQRFTWNPDGTPNFGKPLPLDAEIKEPSGETAAGK